MRFFKPPFSRLTLTMCGTVGIIDGCCQDLSAVVHRMTESLKHRGPDDSGVWVDKDHGVALGHTRLSILDLSSEGHQPMISSSGRYVISYNGEVYNFNELREDVRSDGLIFRGHSDTEVLLACFDKYGIEEAVKKFVGMFAFGLFDKKDKVLYLVRDRLGIKPLYFGWSGSCFLFGSELKSFLRYPGFKPEINRDNISLYLRYSCIPAPYSIYRNIYKLMPGCIFALPIDKSNIHSNFSPHPEAKNVSLRPVRYWDSHKIVSEASENPFAGSECEAVEQLDSLLKEAVRMRMVSDVPLGAFLSGGIDSSVVVAMMQAQSSRPVKTYTIGFQEKEFNEAEHANTIAMHLGTNHTELYITPSEAMDVIKILPQMFDEPFADSSQIPTYLVSKLTRKYVTVSLSGDGGDELFGGYTRHVVCQALWKRIGWMSPCMRRRLAYCLMFLNPDQWNGFFNIFDFIMPMRKQIRFSGDKIYKLARALKEDSPESMYRSLVSHWQRPDCIVMGAKEPDLLLKNLKNDLLISNYAQQTMYLDAITYLTDDILTKLDRTSMYVSLESRVPLLDHRVVEFAWRLPVSMKIRKGRGKWLLRRVLKKYVPENLVERPKMGFSMPVGAWLRTELRDWAEEQLSVKRLREEGFFDPIPIRAKWEEHLRGRGNWQHDLWAVLMFQAWNERRLKENII